MFSTCSVLMAHGVTRKSWEANSDRNRYSSIIMFTSSSSGDDWGCSFENHNSTTSKTNKVPLYGKGSFLAYPIGV